MPPFPEAASTGGIFRSIYILSHWLEQVQRDDAHFMFVMRCCCRAATQKGAEGEAERQLATVKKLKGDIVRKEGMLNAVQAELDKVSWLSYLSCPASKTCVVVWVELVNCGVLCVKCTGSAVPCDMPKPRSEIPANFACLAMHSACVV